MIFGKSLLSVALVACFATQGGLVEAKEAYAQGPLLTIVTNMPEGSWQKVNTNLFSQTWTPADLRPLYLKSNPLPESIIRAWSGFAWDTNRGDLIIYGGGHANYAGNDVYRWRSRNLQWERAALPSQVYQFGTSTIFNAIDGTDAAPIAAHTYDNAIFLSKLDRYLNFGGAAFNTGGPYVRPDEANPSVFRRTGPYFFDPAKANGDQVGGTTGSHVQRVAPYADVVGGNMWQNRDLHKNLPGKTIPVRHVNGCTAYVEEQGREVVYAGAGTSPDATSPDLYRYVPGDVLDPTSDQMARVGIYWNGTSDLTSCAVDPNRNVFVRTGNNTKPFVYWDLSTQGAANKDQSVDVSGSIQNFVSWLSANNKSFRLCALDFDPAREHFLVWCGDGNVWALNPPSPLGRTGWNISLLPLQGSTVPPGSVGRGILGKWKYIPGFDVFLGLQNELEGQIWIYKPIGWQAPNTNNIPPTVEFIQPQEGAELIKGAQTILEVSVSDADGVVSRVDYKVNGSLVATSTTPPFSVNWTPKTLGTMAIQATATDNDGAETESAPVNVLIKSASPSSDPVTKILQRGLDGYEESSDAYLDKYLQTGNTGTRDFLAVYSTNYTPLIKFAIFEREGGPLPDNAIIQNAKLHLYKQNYDFIYTLHPMLRDWSETEASWLKPKANEQWTVAGAGGIDTDYSATPDAKVSAGFSPAWMIFDVTPRLTAFQQGQMNFGWRLVGVSGNGNLKKILSSEYLTDKALRPKLEVTYTTE